MAVRQALIVNEDQTTSLPPEVRLPGMGLTNSEAEALRDEQKQFRLEQSFAPNIVGIDQSGLLRGIHSSDPEISLPSQKLYTKLQTLQADIAELTTVINKAAIVPLRADLKKQHAVCRKLLDAVEAMPEKVGKASNSQKQCQRDWHTANVKLQHVLSTPPDASRFPTDEEYAGWGKRCEVSQSELDTVDERLRGWNEQVTALEHEAAETQRQFTEASRVYMAIQNRINILGGQPPAVTGKQSPLRSEYGL